MRIKITEEQAKRLNILTEDSYPIVNLEQWLIIPKEFPFN